MPHPTDDLRIQRLEVLSPPSQVIGEAPATFSIHDLVGGARRSLHRILTGQDDRLAVIIGPCSIHDPAAARDYARRLAAERARHAGELEILMRVYFEKPRTTVGWKGLINDPGLDGSFRINDGLRVARRLLIDIAALGVPAACEFLDVTTPQYIADLVAWAAIGARTTESQIHREMASGLSCPVGFKNGTNGDVRIAVDAVIAASQPHRFLAVDKDGRAAIAVTTGNRDAHVVLRGGPRPNYGSESIAAAADMLTGSGEAARLVVDVSHANSRKRHENQPLVVADLAAQLAAGEERIRGVMIESHLVAGRQDLVAGAELTYGQSVTDACVGWNTSVALLDELADAVKARRRAVARARACPSGALDFPDLPA
jgi:3-deoxy-7-phosphoheptulonate synthase